MDDRDTQWKDAAYDETLSDALRYGRKTEELLKRYQKQTEDTKGRDVVKDILVSMLSTVVEINSSIEELVGSTKSSGYLKAEPDDKMTSLNAILESTMCTEEMLDAYIIRRYNDLSSQVTIEKMKPIYGKIARVETDIEAALRFLHHLMDDRDTQWKDAAYDETLTDALRYGRKTEELIKRYQKQIEDTKGLDMVKDILVSILSTVGEINSSIEELVGSTNSSDYLKAEPEYKMTSLNSVLESTMCIEKMFATYIVRRYNDLLSRETIEKMKLIQEKIARVETDTEAALRFLDDNPKPILAHNITAGTNVDKLFVVKESSTDDVLHVLKSLAEGVLASVELTKRANQPTDREVLRELCKKRYKI